MCFIQVEQLLDNAVSSGQQILPCVVRQILEGTAGGHWFSLINGPHSCRMSK